MGMEDWWAGIYVSAGDQGGEDGIFTCVCGGAIAGKDGKRYMVPFFYAVFDDVWYDTYMSSTILREAAHFNG